ncbi:MAG: hypothetical protein GXC76_02575 [Rhodanobacteraceae bacterium]|jgi:hypothetical protein|nr:hypothetical protein [Rhodanobacteraceae bacterium]
MTISNTVRNVLLGALLALPAAQAFGADQWHFVVKNKTDSNIVKLEVSIDKKSWGNFDIGSGIGPGATETLVWDASTNDEPCEQWIRAKFKDGSTSEPSKQDFCQDLDDPIEFSE